MLFHISFICAALKARGVALKPGQTKLIDEIYSDDMRAEYTNLWFTKKEQYEEFEYKKDGDTKNIYVPALIKNDNATS
jgi:hypothetical protein